MLDVPQNINPSRPEPRRWFRWEDQSLLPQPAPAPTPTAITPSVAPVVDSIGSHRAGGVIHGVNGDVLVNDHGRDQNRPRGGAGSLNRQANNMRGGRYGDGQTGHGLLGTRQSR